MLSELGDKLRTTAFQILRSQRGNGMRPVKILRDALGTANDLFGRPLCSAEELEARRRAFAGGGGGDGAMGVGRRASAGAATKPASQQEVAPVAVYFDGKDNRTLQRMKELLDGRDIPYQVFDVSDDEATRSWVVTSAKREEFPLCFIAGSCAGDLHELTNLDVNGELERRVFGAGGRAGR